MTNDLLIYGENICAFPHILGTPSSYMILHPIPSEFPYIWGNFSFFFISVRTSCTVNIHSTLTSRPLNKKNKDDLSSAPIQYSLVYSPVFNFTSVYNTSRVRVRVRSGVVWGALNCLNCFRSLLEQLKGFFLMHEEMRKRPCRHTFLRFLISYNYLCIK